MNLIAMMDEAHEQWREQHFMQLQSRKVMGQPMTEEERKWYADYVNEKNYEFNFKPSSCYSCGKDLSAYPKSVTSCPHCHNSFVD